MTSFGKSIRIYLKDGTVTGIKFGEVVNQTIQSISCPRLRVSELINYNEARRPGVYFLFGQDEETYEPKAYIGEAENVYDRLLSHISTKDFWNEVVFFVSKDENLTKAHVKYLESRLVQLSLSTKRYKTENLNLPQQPSLPLADRDAMEEFLVYVKLLLGVLGHKLLEDVIESYRKKESAKQDFSTTEESLSKNTLLNTELFFSVSNYKAKALYTEEGIVVLEGSQATVENSNSLSFGYKEMKERMFQSGELKRESDKFIFTKNVLFDSPSAAAAIIIGYSINGRVNWKDKNGTSLKELEEKIFKPL